MFNQCQSQRFNYPRFKFIFSDYSTYISVGGFDITEPIFNKVLGLYGNYKMNDSSIDDIIGKNQIVFSDAFKRYELFLTLANYNFNDFIKDIETDKGAAFNAKSINLLEFSENDSSFLELFTKNIKEKQMNLLDVFSDLREKYHSAESYFMEDISKCFLGNKLLSDEGEIYVQ